MSIIQLPFSRLGSSNKSGDTPSSKGSKVNQDSDPGLGSFHAVTSLSPFFIQKFRSGFVLARPEPNLILPNPGTAPISCNCIIHTLKLSKKYLRRIDRCTCPSPGPTLVIMGHTESSQLPWISALSVPRVQASHMRFHSAWPLGLSPNC